MFNNKKIHPSIVWLTFLLIVATIVRQLCIEWDVFPYIFPDTSIYYPFGISDWLINYQGGFVRRGLAGEILWRIYQWHPYSVVYAILVIDCIALISITILCTVLFRRMRWPIALLAFPMFLYFPFYGIEGIVGFRRDMLILLLAFYLYWQYKKQLTGGGNILLIWCLSTIIILLHEGIFFSIFPFLALHTFVCKRYSVKRRIVRVLLLWWPVLVSMTVVILFHGNEQTPNLIWDSWKSCFQTYPYGDSNPPLGMSQECLSWSLPRNMNVALDYTWRADFAAGIPAWPFNLYVLVVLYYLFTRMDSLKRGNFFAFERRVQMSNLFMLQLLFTLPMLGLIGCDWFRSVPWCCITTCFLCYLFPKREQMPVLLDKLSVKVQTSIDNLSFAKNPYVYFVVLITLPMCTLSARLGGMFPFIPNDLKNRLLEMVLRGV